jgi:site-specific DNA recombinase
VINQFGGTYESAKNDERKEFQNMLTFAKRNDVSYIIVYSYDRFSRSGDNTIWLGRQLKEAGISIISVTQPVETERVTGGLLQNMMLLFAQLDNDQRRQKTVAGMQERLRKGEWCTMAPIGYKNVRKGALKTIEVDPVYGPLVKCLFE